MPNRYWGPIFAIGGALAATLLVTAIALVTRPTLDKPPTPDAAALSECRYDEASEAAAKAQEAEQKEVGSRNRSARRKRQEETNAAERAKDQAKQCEDRARSDADLLAQRGAAIAAINASKMGERQLWWIAAEFAALLATAILAVVAIVEARGSTRRQLRAYVFVDSVVLTDGQTFEPPMPQFANIPGVMMVVRNSGNTPAHNVVHWAGIDVIGIPLEKQIVAPDISDIHSGTWMPAGGSITKQLIYWQRLSPQQVEAISANQMAIYVYGVIRYRDIFNQVHHTRYVLRYSGRYPASPDAKLLFADEGNYAD